MVTLALVLSNANAAGEHGSGLGLLDLGRAVDRSPAFDAVFVGDSLLTVARLESVTTLAALAGVTERVKLGVGCMASIALRDPLLLAQQWATLDELADGRGIFVACNGPKRAPGAEDELARYELDYPKRVARTTATLGFLRAVASGATDVPLPDGHIPYSGPKFGDGEERRFWLAANPPSSADEQRVRRILERVGRVANGWMTFGADPALLARRVATLHTILEGQGKDPANFSVCTYLDVNIDVSTDRALADAVATNRREGRAARDPETIRKSAAVGPAEMCVQRIGELAEAGATMIALRPVSVDPHVQIRRIQRDVAQHLPVGSGRAMEILP